MTRLNLSLEKYKSPQRRKGRKDDVLVITAKTLMPHQKDLSVVKILQIVMSLDE